MPCVSDRDTQIEGLALEGTADPRGMSVREPASTSPSRRGESALLVLAVFGASTTIAVADGLAQVFAAGVLGALLTLAIVGWKVGGHVTSLVWLWVGKQKTEAVLRQLDDDWSCEHDIPHRRGMWDHVARRALRCLHAGVEGSRHGPPTSLPTRSAPAAGGSRPGGYAVRQSR